jgi:hypothetical protein
MSLVDGVMKAVTCEAKLRPVLPLSWTLVPNSSITRHLAKGCMRLGGKITDDVKLNDISRTSTESGVNALNA